jgi:glyoxylase-like metal-dependent hydrolase (beta-lactamase superfamily II)
MALFPPSRCHFRDDRFIEAGRRERRNSARVTPPYTFTQGRYPNIDFANGGNIKGMIAATDAYLKLANAKTRIVPGHGPLADKAALAEYRTMLITARDRMTKLVKDGKTEDEVVAAKPFADLDARWAPTELAGRNFIRVVYHSLADKPDTGRPSLKRLLRRS